MPTIHLIRHGQKQLNLDNPSLTKLGIEQAKQTGKYFSQFPINQIIASPQNRTAETAAYIGDQLSLPFSKDERLLERMDFYEPDTTRENFLQEWIKATHDRDYDPKYGDSSRATGERVSNLIKSLKLAEGQDILLVTHGGAIIDYLRNQFGDDSVMTLIKQYDLGQDYQMHNCAINSISFVSNPKLEKLNYAKHLTDLSE
ncbi:MAG: histidine phosphatase family protein [Patescibacteria group bacterium]